jgi:phosphatidylglycerol lysyltransferase
VIRRALRLVLRQRVAVSLAALVVLVGVVAAPLRFADEAGFRAVVGTGLGPLESLHNLWSPLTFTLFADGPLEYLAALGGILGLVGLAERLMGRWRTVVGFVVTPAVGAVLGMAVQATNVAELGAWNDGIPVIDPVSPVVGTLLMASAWANQLWRRRIRIVGFAGLLVMTLYSGSTVDVIRLFTALAGLVLGVVLVPVGQRVLRWVRSSQHEARSLFAALLLVSAVGPFVAIASGVPWGPLHPLGLLFRERISSESTDDCGAGLATRACVHALAVARLDGPGPVLLSMLPLLLLALAAYGLLRGRLVAAWLAILVNLYFAGLAVFYYAFLPVVPDGGQLRRLTHEGTLLPIALSVILPLALAATVALSLQHFPVRPSRGTLRRYLGTIGSTAVGCAVLYVGGGTLVASQFEPPVTTVALLLDLPERFVPTGYLHLRGLEFLPSGPLAGALYNGIGPAFWTVLLVASAAVIYGAAGRTKASDLSRVRALLKTTGGDGTQSYMATWQGNEYWFLPDGSAAVAYRIVNDVAITMGGPIGCPERRRESLTAFAEFCRQHGWSPVFYGISAEVRSELQEIGWMSAPIGDDAVLEPARVTMTGKKWQDVRSSLNRADRAGIVAEQTSWDRLGLPARTQVEVISEEWVSGRNLPEMGFTLGGLDELRDPEVQLLLAVAPGGRIQAVTSWLPTYRGGEVIGWTLDFMRRRPDSMNGVVEFLIARMVQLSAERGIEFVSLSAAPLAGLATEPGEQELTPRMLAFLGRRLESLYGFKSLLAFKIKFQPTFSPLFLAFPDPMLLPAVGIAVARAYLPSMTFQQSVVLIRSLMRTGEETTPLPPERVPAA